MTEKIDRRGRQRHDRAQLILIAAVIIAVFVLGAVVLLNLLHESPEFKSEQDRVSVETSERTSAQLETNLERYFLAHSADDEPPGLDSEPDDASAFQLPFASSPADFSQELEDALVGPYSSLTAGTRVSIINVELNEPASDSGAIVWKNTTTDHAGNGSNPSQGTYLDNAQAMPRLYMQFESFEGLQMILQLDGDDYLTLTDDEATVEIGQSRGDCDNIEVPFEVDLVHGAGEIRSDEAFCRVNLDMPSGGFDIALQGQPAINNSQWKYFISGSNAVVNSTHENEDIFFEDDDGNQQPDTFVWGRENVLVDPTFEIVYEDAKIRYQATLDLYREDNA